MNWSYVYHSVVGNMHGDEEHKTVCVEAIDKNGDSVVVPLEIVEVPIEDSRPPAGKYFLRAVAGSRLFVGQ